MIIQTNIINYFEGHLWDIKKKVRSNYRDDYSVDLLNFNVLVGHSFFMNNRYRKKINVSKL